MLLGDKAGNQRDTNDYQFTSCILGQKAPLLIRGRINEGPVQLGRVLWGLLKA